MSTSGTFRAQTTVATGMSGATMMLMFYGYLQVLDLMTTTAFLASGVAEANPVIRYMMSFVSTPLLGLIAGKILAFMLGVFCWKYDRVALLRKANVFFGLLIVWNLLALILNA